MWLVEHDDRVDTLSPNRIDQTFNARRLPRRAIRDDDLLDAHVLNTLAELKAVESITIPDEKAWRFVVGKGVNDLLSGPPRSRMSRNVEVSDRSTVVTEHDEAKQYAKRGARDGEEVNRDDIWSMIVEKGMPSL